MKGVSHPRERRAHPAPRDAGPGRPRVAPPDMTIKELPPPALLLPPRTASFSTCVRDARAERAGRTELGPAHDKTWEAGRCGSSRGTLRPRSPHFALRCCLAAAAPLRRLMRGKPQQ